MRVVLKYSFLFAVLAALLFSTVVAAVSHHGYTKCDPSVVQSSGYIDIPGKQGTQKHYFYWLFGPRRWPADGSQPPVIMWMTGGPGCSSGIALTLELGPCMMNESTGNLYYNPYGWNDEAYLLFVDQPTGVGYSHGDKMNYAHNQSEVAKDMYNFLQGFAKKFTTPSITGANDFYIIGESYAGHYVPAVAYEVFQRNQAGADPHINLKGISIGNGWTDPYTQYPSYVEIAYDFCKERLGAPCINESLRDEMLRRMPHCLELTAECNSYVNDTDPSCAEAYSYCQALADLYMETGLNTLDMRVKSEGSLGYSMEYSTALYANPEVRAALGVAAPAQWATCAADVGPFFDNDEQRNFNWTIPPMLAGGIRVMIYAGDMDYICNWIGNKAWVTALEWPGKAGFNAAPDVEFSVNGRAAGQERQYGNFSFVRIYDAGHMVPMDQPEVALYMLSRFLHNHRLSG